MENREFGARLRELRKEAGLSQRELADKIGVNFSYLSKIESGVMPPPSDKIIEKLAEVLKADKDELLTLAGRIPPDIVQILRNRKVLQRLRKERRQKKTETMGIFKRAIPINLKNLGRVALAFTLVAAIGASLWFAAPIPVRALTVTAPVANSAISGNTTYLLGEKISIPATLRFSSEFKQFDSISLNISGPESFVKTLPLPPGTYNYTDIPGSLDVTVTHGTGITTGAYGYGYGIASGTANITYDIKWTSPYTLTTSPPGPPVNLPSVSTGFDISVPESVNSAISPATYYPQGLSVNGSDLYILMPADIYDGGSYYDAIIKTDISGTYVSHFRAPGSSWSTEALTFIGNDLYAAYNEWTSTGYKGRVAKYSFSSGNWTLISGLSTLDPIGGLASDGTNLFVAYRDRLGIDKRNPTTGASINNWDLSNAWGAGMWPPMWGFDALAYGSDLYAGQGETIIKVDPTTGAKTGEYKTGKWNIRGLDFVDTVFSNGTFKILYLTVYEWMGGKVYRAAKAGDTPLVENTPIGSYNTRFEVVTNPTTTSATSSFTLSKLATDPVVTITTPSPNFAYGAGSENITVAGSINDPSISTVTVGIALPQVTAFSDDIENQTQTSAKWSHSAVSGMSLWMTYSTEDIWHRSSARSSDTKPGVGAVGAAWRYANSSTGIFASSDSWKANAGALRTKEAIAIGDNNMLTFWTWYDSDLDFWPDRKLVEVSTDNATWTTVAWLAKFWPPFMPPDITQQQYNALRMVPERVWTKVELSLVAYAGQNIYLRFRFDTMDDWNNNFEGWYIDDISITGAGFLGKAAAVDANRQFSANFTLAEGSNAITVTARRTNYEPRLTGSSSVTGSLDTISPILRLSPVTTPTNQAYQIISGNVTEANFDRLELKKNNALIWSTRVLGSGGTFSQSILLDEGNNDIFVKVYDKVDLSANTTATVKLDTTGPVFSAVFPGSANQTYDIAYNTGEVSARPGDSFFIAVKVTDAASDVASVRIVIPGLPASQQPGPAMRKTDLPEAVIDSWGIKSTTKAQMNYIMPMQLPSSAPSGNYTWTVVARDTAGNSSNITVITKVVSTLEAFNIYLMPDWNLVSTPVIPTTANITTLTAGIAATELFERVWYYDASRAGTVDEWKVYVPGVGGDLTTIGAGKGYWFKMKPLTTVTATAGIDSFTEAGKVSGPMMSGLPDTPAPVKLTISGMVLQPGAVTPPTYPVYAGWNLVGLHSEFPLPVSTALQSVTVPQQKWGSLLQYLNYITFPMVEGAMPQIDLGRFDRLISTETMEPGRGFWLYMVEAGIIVP